jgi:hypothetical protein
MLIEYGIARMEPLSLLCGVLLAAFTALDTALRASRTELLLLSHRRRKRLRRLLSSWPRGLFFQGHNVNVAHELQPILE